MKTNGNNLGMPDVFNYRERDRINQLMLDRDNFFLRFAGLEDLAYSEGVISKKYKELTGLSIAILTKSEDGILCHLQGSLSEDATTDEIIEAIKIGVVEGGSTSYPSAKFAFQKLKELELIGF